MQKNAFVKLPRELICMEYLLDKNILKTIIYLYSYARFLPGYIYGIYVDVGQVLISVGELSTILKIPKSTMRFVIGRLERDGVLTKERVSNSHTLITLNHYNKQPAPSTMLKGYIELSEDEDE